MTGERGAGSGIGAAPLPVPRSPLPDPVPSPVPPRPRYRIGALRHRNFRIFLGGQVLSLTGTWMQSVAQGWLVLQLTDSPFQVGLVTTLSTLPVFLLTLPGGVLADRVDKSRLIFLLQAGMLAEALALALLTATGQVTVGWVMGLAFFFGLLTAFEVPARQAFVIELVGRTDLPSAIALNSTAFNVTRVVGPSVAGVLIASVGVRSAGLSTADTRVSAARNDRHLAPMSCVATTPSIAL